MSNLHYNFPQVIEQNICSMTWRYDQRFFPSSRWYTVFISEVGFSSRKTLGGTHEDQSTIGKVSSLCCLFCIRFKQTHNDKPLCSSPLSPSRLAGVSHSLPCNSCLTMYNYVVGATRMEPCRRKKKKKHRNTEISIQGRVEKLQPKSLTHEGI